MSYSIWVCPKCSEQQSDDCHEPYGHTHDDVYYPGLELQAFVYPSQIEFGEARRAAEAAHAEAERRRAADKAELEAMEAEWRATAPPEQIEALERSRQQKRTLSRIVREVWCGPEMKAEMAFMNRQAFATFMGTPEERAAIEQERLAAKRQRLEDGLARFGREGPAAVSFYRLLTIRRELEELDA